MLFVLPLYANVVESHEAIAPDAKPCADRECCGQFASIFGTTHPFVTPSNRQIPKRRLELCNVILDSCLAINLFDLGSLKRLTLGALLLELIDCVELRKRSTVDGSARTSQDQ